MSRVYELGLSVVGFQWVGLYVLLSVEEAEASPLAKQYLI